MTYGRDTEQGAFFIMADYRKLYEKSFGITWDRNLYDVHHIDKNRNNNNISNLLLLPKDLHLKLHYNLIIIEPIKNMTIDEIIHILFSSSYNVLSSKYYALSLVIDYLDEVGFWVLLKERRYARESLKEFNVDGIELLG